MDNKIHLNRTSDRTANVTETILRDKKNSKVIFRPTIIVNSKNLNESVKGKIIYAKDEVNKTDDTFLSPSKLRKGDWYEIELHSDEVMKLFNSLRLLYEIKELDEVTYIRVDTSRDDFLDFFNSNPNVFKEVLVEEKTLEFIVESEEIIIALSNRADFIDKLIELDEVEIGNLITGVQLKSIEALGIMISNNLGNNNEEFWQREVFSKYSWILSQLVSKPLMMHEDKAYLGGKTIGDSSGKVIDYVYKNKLTDSIVLIEIKTPMSKLIMKSEYRADVYAVHKELSGAISQCLVYKDVLQKEYYSLVRNSKNTFEVFNPKILLIIGKLEELSSKQMRSFELYRRELKDIEIITFDEILERLRGLCRSLKGERV